MENTFNKINKNESYQNLLRTHCISVRLNHEELQLLNAKRGEKSKGEWLRLASHSSSFNQHRSLEIPQRNITEAEQATYSSRK